MHFSVSSLFSTKAIVVRVLPCSWFTRIATLQHAQHPYFDCVLRSLYHLALHCVAAPSSVTLRSQLQLQPTHATTLRPADCAACVATSWRASPWLAPQAMRYACHFFQFQIVLSLSGSYASFKEGSVDPFLDNSGSSNDVRAWCRKFGGWLCYPMLSHRIRFMRCTCWIHKTINTHSEYVFIFHGNNGFANVPHCYVRRTLSVLFMLI